MRISACGTHARAVAPLRGAPHFCCLTMATPSVDAGNSSDDVPTAKKLRSTLTPSSFTTWNCNGLLTRCKFNQQDLERMVGATNTPDVIFLQEVRLKATSCHRRDTPCREDSNVVESLFCGGPFQEYEPFWSLADTRYSGTCTLIHKRLGADKNMAAFSTQSAIDLLLQKYGFTRSDVGIPENTASSSSSSKPAAKQASIKSFFSANNKNSAVSTITKQHHEEGRFQFFSFPEMDLIHTYVPNNGTKPESYQRRKQWDDAMLHFLQNRKVILEKAGCSNRKLLWAGDMNVARKYRDGTHWSQGEGGEIEEWWTNERKCFLKPGDPSRAAEHCGMPSFTPAERTRFENILQQGNLTDVWRELHPQGSTTHSHLSQWERPDYTWRGHAGKTKKAKYEGTGQRLDYYLTANVAMESVEECEILGYGSIRDGLFCGSDHCAVKLELSK